MSKNNNIIWFLVDSVRNYKTSVDERGLLPIMEDLGEDCIYFKNVITSAPSTIMSVSAMMTSVSAIYQSRDYQSFDYREEYFSSFPTILSEQNYHIYSLIFFPEGRAFLKNIFQNTCEEFWEGKYNENSFWTNDQMNELLESVLNKGLKEPFFLYVHYNCRNDYNTNEKIKNGIEILKRNKLFS